MFPFVLGTGDYDLNFWILFYFAFTRENQKSMVSSIGVVCALTHCALLHSVQRWTCDVICFGNLWFMSSNCPLALLKYQKNIVDFSAATKWFMKFRSGCKNLDDQVISGRSRTTDFGAGFQNEDRNPVSRTRRVSVEFSILAFWPPQQKLAQSAGAIEYTDCITLLRGKTPTKLGS